MASQVPQDVGIVALEYYFPQQYVNQTELGKMKLHRAKKRKEKKRKEKKRWEIIVQNNNKTLFYREIW